jgi:RND family efflux transporter MFP subunit
VVTKYVAAPTDSDILAARAGVTQAKASLQEATYLYNALTGGQVPDDATGSGLTALENAKLALQSAQNDLDGISIVAPFSGTIMAVNSKVGDTIGNSTAIITLADLSQPSLDIYLDASDWNNVKLGYDAEVTFDNLPDTKFTGKVTQVDPGLSTQSGSSVIHAVVKLDKIDNSLNLPLGASAAVDVIAGQARNAVLVPVEALHQAGDSYTVFVVENGKLKLHVVKIGIQDLTFAEVKSGLKAGDVVSTGIAQTSANAQTSTP